MVGSLRSCLTMQCSRAIRSARAKGQARRPYAAPSTACGARTVSSCRTRPRRLARPGCMSARAYPAASSLPESAAPGRQPMPSAAHQRQARSLAVLPGKPARLVTHSRPPARPSTICTMLVLIDKSTLVPLRRYDCMMSSNNSVSASGRLTKDVAAAAAYCSELFLPCAVFLS